MSGSGWIDKHTRIDDLLSELVDTGLIPRVLVRSVPQEMADFSFRDVDLTVQTNGTYHLPGDDRDFDGATIEAGGADYVSYAVASKSGEPFSVWFDWQSQSGSRIVSVGPYDVEGKPTVVEPDFYGRFVSFSQDTQSDFCRIRIVDESDADRNVVNGTFNFK